MDELKLFTAKVVSISDSQKQGRVQVRILPYFEKMKDSDLPWASPFILEQSSSTLNNDLPRVDSTVYVLADKYFKKFYWLGNRYFYGLFDFSKASNVLSKGKDANKSPIDTTYENLIFRLYDDGGLEFHNNKDGSHGFIHKSGSFVLFDKNGAIVTETPNQTYTFTNGVDSLGSLLEELINDLAGLVTSGSPTNHTSPQLTAQMQVLLPKVKALFK